MIAAAAPGGYDPYRTIIVHPAALAELGVRSGDVVRVSDGGLVGGAGFPPTPSTMEVRVIAAEYLPPPSAPPKPKSTTAFWRALPQWQTRRK